MKYLQQLANGGAARVTVLLSSCQPASEDLPRHHNLSATRSVRDVERVVQPLESR